MTVSVKTTRKSEINPRNLRKGGVEVGVMSGSATGEGSASLVEIAVWNEFGTERTDAEGKKKKHIPARPFMHSTADLKKREWLKVIERVNKLVLEGKLDSVIASEILGVQIQADIQQRIIDLRDPPNVASTIKQKGSDNPLIDTGSLKDSVKYVVLGS